MVSQEPTTSDGTLGMYINLEMYQLIVVWSNKRFTCCIKGELHIRKCSLSICTCFDMDIFLEGFLARPHVLIFFLSFMGRPLSFMKNGTVDNGKEQSDY